MCSCLSIGSDSHISVDASSELRLLEYAQRLTQRRRAILCTDHESCGNFLYRNANEGGAQVTGFGTGHLQVGQPALWSELDAAHTLIQKTDYSVVQQPADERLLDSYVFSELPFTAIKTR